MKRKRLVCAILYIVMSVLSACYPAEQRIVETKGIESSNDIVYMDGTGYRFYGFVSNSAGKRLREEMIGASSESEDLKIYSLLHYNDEFVLILLDVFMSRGAGYSLYVREDYEDIPADFELEDDSYFLKNYSQ